ncbi:MAG TPA: hypothetical protein VNL74_03125 [Methylococcus sp.]|nr:hypothetical protein [Methylococcus sp.]
MTLSPSLREMDFNGLSVWLHPKMDPKEGKVKQRYGTFHDLATRAEIAVFDSGRLGKSGKSV